MLSQQLRESIFVAAPIGAWHVARCYIWRAVLPTVLTAPSRCPGRKSVPPCIEMDGNGRVAGNHFRRQGLAEASERVLDAPRTLEGMNACRNPKSRPLDFPRTRHLNKEARKSKRQRVFTEWGCVMSPALPFAVAVRKSAAPRGREGAQRPKIIFWRLARFGGEDPARGPARLQGTCP